MRSGDDQAAVKSAVGDGEVQHLRANLPEHGDIGAAVGGATNGSLSERGRREAHVVADGDPLGAEHLDVGTGDAIRTVGIELVRDDAADVVSLEDGCVERHA